MSDPDGGLRQRMSLEHPRSANHAAFSPDATVLAVTSKEIPAEPVPYDPSAIWLWDVTSGQLITKFAHEFAGSLAFSPDGSLLASQGMHRFLLWDMAHREPSIDIPAGAATIMDKDTPFSANGAVLVTSDNKTIWVWDVAARRTVASFEHTEWVMRGALSPDGALLATVSSPDDILRIWDIGTGKALATLGGHRGSVAFSPDGALLAAVSVDRTVRLWERGTGQYRREALSGHTNHVKALAFSPDSAALATGSLDKTVALWDLATGRPSVVLKGMKVRSSTWRSPRTVICSPPARRNRSIFGMCTCGNTAPPSPGFAAPCSSRPLVTCS
jgi:WD40 repeat protein